jgi:hypothetical protein
MNAIIAVNPQQMQEAQATTTGWIAAKLADAEHDLLIAKDTFAALDKAGLRTKPAEALAVKANRRIKFYTKVRAALEAGYVIIPPFNIQLFAVRTNRVCAPENVSDKQWQQEMKPAMLPAGEGRYENPAVARVKAGTVKRKNHSGESYDVTLFKNLNWQDGIDMPVRAMKPQIIEAVGRALEEKIFDALGIAPAYRAADPIIAGQINRPDGKGPLTFFIAWWLESEDI